MVVREIKTGRQARKLVSKDGGLNEEMAVLGNCSKGIWAASN